MNHASGRVYQRIPNSCRLMGCMQRCVWHRENETVMQHAIPAQTSGLLRRLDFDSLFIVGILALGLLAGAVVIGTPTLFPFIVTLDLWLLGYHHVISTYTRLVFDTESFNRHKALVLYLLPAVLGVVAVMGTLGGRWLLATTYLYWQWYHYTRQSEGISKAYARKAQEKELGNPTITRLAFWLVPVAGIVNVSFRSPAFFLGMPVSTFPVSAEVVTVLNWAAAGLVVLWGWQQMKAMRKGTFALPYACYMCSHFIIFYMAYICVTETNVGWLMINVWHNAQYIAFVWLFNSNRFKHGIEQQHLFLSTMSQPNNIVRYVITCLAVSTLAYFCIQQLLGIFTVGMIALPLIVYQTINFHHYLVDGVIWKLRKKTLQVNLGLT